MRLHRLEVTAFGPFAGTEVVDFDRLAEPGLFLLHGPTGAGKSSVLDAVCFALYGQVPGARGQGRQRLRSDHATPDVAPCVVLEVTLGGRRIEITRSPEWRRPKRRGEGTTREPASADVRELVDGQWQVLSARRSDEAGLLLNDLLGMGLEQFTKVVMLPQGEFAAFLRAGAESRGELLGKLFSIDRFTAVECWLRDERQRLAREVADVRAARADLVARAEEAVSLLGTMTASGPAELALASSDDVELVEGYAAVAQTLLASAANQAQARAADASAAETALATGSQVAARVARRAEVLGRKATLDRRADEHARDAARLAAARRAVPVHPLIVAVDHAQQLATEALDEVNRCRAGAPQAVATKNQPQLSRELSSRQGDLGRLADARASVDELARVLERTTLLEQTLAAAADAGAAVETALSTAVDEVTKHQADIERLSQEAHDLTASQAAFERARAVVTAAGQLIACDDDLARAQDARRAAHDAELTAREALLDVRDRRLAGIAAELAHELRDEQPCPVCGATEHPKPRRAADDHVGPSAELEARGHHDAAEQALRTAEGVVGAHTARQADLRARTDGLDLPQAQARLAAARDQVEAATTAGTALEGSRAALRSATQAVERLTTQRATVQRESTIATTSRDEARARADELQVRLDVLRGQDADVPARERRLTAEAAAIEAWREAAAAEKAAQVHLATERSRLDAAADCGFDDVLGARTAALEPAELDELTASVEGHDRELDQVATLLGSPELAELAGVESPRLIDLQQAAAQAAGRRREAEQRQTLAEQAKRSLDRLAAQLRTHTDLHAPLLARYEHVDELSRCVDGTGGGNTRRMRLSAFVLAARLEEVAAAASGRLMAMSDGRFSLAHTDDLVKGGARSGLGLHVVDGWTGVARETTTLSGGESFLASLALALGLADVVRAESGGASIETLFVDEGFGTLDEDALEEVMAVLDGLRDGGRAVGLVSHVAGLRHRITSQLAVRKGRTGSSLAQQSPSAPAGRDRDVA